MEHISIELQSNRRWLEGYRETKPTNERREEAGVEHGGVEALLGEDEGREGPRHERHEQRGEDELADPLIRPPKLLWERSLPRVNNSLLHKSLRSLVQILAIAIVP